MAKRRIPILFLMVIMLSLLMASCFAVPAKCATSGGITTLKANTVYTSYDVTGDGRKDRFKINQPKYSGGYYQKIQISVNGKTAFQVSGKEWFYSATYKLITLSNGKKFLFINTEGDEYCGPVKVVLQYKNGKFTKVVDFDTVLDKHGSLHNVKLSSVKGSAVTFNIHLMSFATGPSDYVMQYIYQGGTLKQNSSAARLVSVNLYSGKTRTLYVNRKINAYTTTSTDKRAFVLYYGDKVTIDQVRVSSTRMLLRAKCGNKTGWIIAANKYADSWYDMQFQDVHYTNS